MQLQEIMKKAYAWKWKDDARYPEGEFVVDDGSKFVVNFDLTGDKGWDVSFIRWDAKNKPSHAVTGTGDQFKVFATVFEILKYFIKSKKPTRFYFSGTGKSRTNLYSRFAKKYAKNLGYKNVGSEFMHSSVGPSRTEFYFEKIK